MTVSLSYDECRTWPVHKLIYEGPGEYSDLAIAPDMTALLIYGKDTHREPLKARNRFQATDML